MAARFLIHGCLNLQEFNEFNYWAATLKISKTELVNKAIHKYMSILALEHIGKIPNEPTEAKIKLQASKLILEKLDLKIEKFKHSSYAIYRTLKSFRKEIMPTINELERKSKCLK
jgi:hypothetical protein